VSIALSRLGNGLTVVTHRMPHLESVALGLWVGTGARSESDGQHGISHLLEHMAFKGTHRRTAVEIAETVEAVGGEINAETSIEHTTYYLRLLKEDIALGMDVLGDVITDPLLDPTELALEQHVILQEIGAAHDAPEDWVYELFQESAYPGQPIGRTILGTPESVRGQTPADLRAFLAAQYRGPSMVVAAAGNLDHEHVLRLAETHLGSFVGEHPAAPLPGTYQGGEQRENRALKETQLLIGFAAPALTDRFFATAHVFSAIAGGGMASRLFQELRENRGLCYSVSSFYWAFADTGLFGVHMAASEVDAAPLMPLAVDELGKMLDGVTAAELARAKAQMRAGLLMTLESPLARAGQLARHIFVYGRPLSLEESLAMVDAVTIDDVVALGRSMLASPPTLAAVGPLNGLPAIDDIAARVAKWSAGRV
jgi:predicted Zn-dependent peptidase